VYEDDDDEARGDDGRDDKTTQELKFRRVLALCEVHALVQVSGRHGGIVRLYESFRYDSNHKPDFDLAGTTGSGGGTSKATSSPASSKSARYSDVYLLLEYMDGGSLADVVDRAAKVKRYREGNSCGGSAPTPSFGPTLPSPTLPVSTPLPVQQQPQQHHLSPPRPSELDRQCYELVRDEAWVRDVMGQVTSAVEFLHGQKLFHRDLKPENLLLCGNLDEPICKVSDFSLCRRYDVPLVDDDDDVDGANGDGHRAHQYRAGNRHGSSASNRSSSSAWLDLEEYVSTRWYRAPEVLEGCLEFQREQLLLQEQQVQRQLQFEFSQFDDPEEEQKLQQHQQVEQQQYRPPIANREPRYGPPMDMWALGTITYELLDLEPLFPGSSVENQMSMYRQNLPLEAEKVLSWIPHASSDAVAFLQGLLQEDPSRRMTASDALQHRFLSKQKQPEEEAMIRCRYPIASAVSTPAPRSSVDSGTIPDSASASWGEAEPEDDFGFSRGHPATATGTMATSSTTYGLPIVTTDKKLHHNNGENCATLNLSRVLASTRGIKRFLNRENSGDVPFAETARIHNPYRSTKKQKTPHW